MLDPKNFCSAPFRAVVIDTDGTMLPCCEYKYPAPTFKSKNNFSTFGFWWNKELDQLRQDMRTGQHNDGCTYCKNKEQIPGQSHLRKYHNFRYPITNNNFSLEIKRVEIRFGNYCNLKCMMCGPYASSSLSEEYIRHKQTFLLNNFKTDAKRTVRWWEEPGAYDRLYHIVKNVDEIHMTGGEPMMTPEVADILNSIENTDVRISFNTNMTKFSDRIFDALSRFKKVEIYASLEGIEKHNDYIRYGSEWAVIEQAIEKIKTYPGIRLSIHPVLQHVSIYSMPNLVEFANNNKIRLQFNEIYPESAYGDNNGGYLTLNSAAPNDVDKFKQYLAQHPNPTLEKWASTYKFDPELHATFRRFVAMTDSIRGVSFEQTFNPSWI